MHFCFEYNVFIFKKRIIIDIVRTLVRAASELDISDVGHATRGKLHY